MICTDSLKGYSFAWMEILKTTAVILKLFSIERTNINPTVMKEGFFNKAAECEVEIRRRDFTRENE